MNTAKKIEFIDGPKTLEEICAAIDADLRFATGRRSLVRAVYEHAAVRRVLRELKEAVAENIAYVVCHGGDVANAYGYRAWTETLFVAAMVVDGTIRIWWHASHLPANKVTLGGVAGAWSRKLRPLGDLRFSVEAKAIAIEALRDEIINEGVDLVK